MVLFAMASLALPGLNGFVSEFLCLMGVYTADAGMRTGFPGVLGPWYALLAGTALVLGALYVLRMLQKFVFGPLREPAHEGHGHHHEVRDLNGREILSMLPLAAGCIVIGLWPKPLLVAIEPVAAQVAAPYVKLIERDAAKRAAEAEAAAGPSATTASAAATATGAIE